MTEIFNDVAEREVFRFKADLAGFPYRKEHGGRAVPVAKEDLRGVWYPNGLEPVIRDQKKEEEPPPTEEHVDTAAQDVVDHLAGRIIGECNRDQDPTSMFLHDDMLMLTITVGIEREELVEMVGEAAAQALIDRIGMLG